MMISTSSTSSTSSEAHKKKISSNHPPCRPPGSAFMNKPTKLSPGCTQLSKICTTQRKKKRGQKINPSQVHFNEFHFTSCCFLAIHFRIDRTSKKKIIPWVVPPPSNSHHQDYYIFSRDPYKPSFATVTGRGDNPNHSPK